MNKFREGNKAWGIGKEEVLKVTFTHPDPKEEKKMAKSFEVFVKALGKITGEKVKIIKRSHS